MGHVRSAGSSVPGCCNAARMSECRASSCGLSSDHGIDTPQYGQNGCARKLVSALPHPLFRIDSFRSASRRRTPPCVRITLLHPSFPTKPAWTGRALSLLPFLTSHTASRLRFECRRERQESAGRSTPNRTSRNQGTPCDGPQTSLRPNGGDPPIPMASNAKDRTSPSVLLLGRPSLPTSHLVRVEHVEGSRGLRAPPDRTERSKVHSQPSEGDTPHGVKRWRQRGAIHCGKENEREPGRIGPANLTRNPYHPEIDPVVEPGNVSRERRDSYLNHAGADERQKIFELRHFRAPKTSDGGYKVRELSRGCLRPAAGFAAEDGLRTKARDKGKRVAVISRGLTDTHTLPNDVNRLTLHGR